MISRIEPRCERIVSDCRATRKRHDGTARPGAGASGGAPHRQPRRRLRSRTGMGRGDPPPCGGAWKWNRRDHARVRGLRSGSVANPVKPAVFLAEAETEFAEAAIFYESQSPGLGNDFIAEVERSVDEISRHPELGASYFEDTRRIFVRRFPFRVVYQERTERILIFAVAHQRRKPGYWRDRNKESPGESFDARRGRFAFGSAPVIGYWLLVTGYWQIQKPKTGSEATPIR